jgi:hypothetical protein
MAGLVFISLGAVSFAADNPYAVPEAPALPLSNMG